MVDFITGFIERFGYLGVALLMAAENIFPPIPSELIMPFAGAAAARGELSLAGLVVAGGIGSLLGTLPWYWLGRSIGAERLRAWVRRHGRWLAMTPPDLARAEDWFGRKGGWALLGGRMVPAVRSVISMPAGIARMPLATMLAWSAGGTLAWSALLAGLGYALAEQYARVADVVDTVATGVVMVLAVVYAWRVVAIPRSQEG
ncbi:MAG: DedA family protein [Burkholderiales bacterium]|jgi:membrane protein DedA with SNARE-associated domain|nr:DedA family protein [Burkholderiales bacterium]